MAPKMPGVWENAGFLNDLAMVLYEAAHVAGGLGPAAREAMIDCLAKAGHDVSWEAVRMASRQLMRWDPVVHEDILIALFQHVSLTSSDWAKVMDELRAMGYAFSGSALRQHVQKLRKSRDLTGFAKSADASPSPATPTKTGRKRKVPSKRNVKELSPVDDDEVKNLKAENLSDEEMQFETPVKKRRVKKEQILPVAYDAADDEI